MSMRTLREWTKCGLLLFVIVPVSTSRAQSERPIAPLGLEPAVPLMRQGILRPGEVVTLRVRQVIPRDGSSPGDRVLNGLLTIVPGDRVLAEVIAPKAGPPALVGGTVADITPPGRFAKSGRITLELGQLVTTSDGKSEMIPWIFDLEDRRFNIKMRRKILLALFALEGAGVGASVGSNLEGGNNPLFIGGGAAVGLLSGIGYASLMPGHQPTLEPGDTFKVEVGTLSYRPLPSSPTLPLYPPENAARNRGTHKP
jgi:hypothetical protein